MVEATITDIGYNDFIKRGKRSFHIQTEVIESDSIIIRTTIMEGGLVVDAVSQTCEPEAHDIVHKGNLAKAQHKKALNEVQKGKYG